MHILQFASAIFVLLSLFLFPWVVIAPHAFLPQTVQTGLDILGTAIHHLAPAPVPGVLDLLEAITSLSATKLLASGFLNPWMWFIILLPMTVAAMALISGLLGMLFNSDSLTRLSGWIGSIGGSLALVLLIISLPQIEHLGLGGSYLARLGLALAGLHLAWGYWGTLLALLVLAASSAACAMGYGAPAPKKKGAPEYRQGVRPR